MGIDMELDLITGLGMPKAALKELDTLESSGLPEGKLAGFAALLEGAEAEETPMSSETISPEFLASIPVAIPREQMPKPGDSDIGAEADKGAERDIDPGKKVAPEDAAQVITLPPVPAVAVAAEPARALPATVAGKDKSIPVISTNSGKLEQPATSDRSAQAAPEARTSSMLEAPQDGKKLALRATAIAPKPKPSGAKISPFSGDTVSNALPPETPEEPAKDIKNRPAQAALKTTLPQAAPLAEVSNFDITKDTAAEVQFGLKIERQLVEVAPSFRTAPPTPPVAEQISAQLPQQLTKAEKQTVELRLDPPELGRVTIHLTTHDQQVTAHVVADRVDTVDLMRRHAEVLNATFARAGFSQADLSFQQGHSQAEKHEFEQFQGFAGLSEGDSITAPAPTLAANDGRLDIRL